MRQGERFEIVILGSGEAGKLLAWQRDGPPWWSGDGSAAHEHHLHAQQERDSKCRVRTSFASCR
jgi:hypothetical protein